MLLDLYPQLTSAPAARTQAATTIATLSELSSAAGRRFVIEDEEAVLLASALTLITP
jgi:hypothetical protein